MPSYFKNNFYLENVKSMSKNFSIRLHLDKIKHKITSAPEMIEPIDVSSYTVLKQNRTKYKSFEKEQKTLIHTLELGVIATDQTVNGSGLDAFEQRIEDMETWVKDTKGQNRRVIISSKPISW